MARASESVWLNLEKYSVNLVDKLGSGTFGIVYMGKENKRGSPVAVKEVKLETDQKGGDAMREIKNLLKLPEHDNVVHFLDFHFSRNAIWMVMEYCDMGDLVEYYQKYKPIHIATNVSFMCQIASAIAHMHSLPEAIVHRDIKPANIMLMYCGDKPVIKITDFGLAKVAGDKVDSAKTFLMTTVGGTPGFMAPELFAKQKYTASVDVFALGLVMLGMLTYENNKEMLPPIEGGMLCAPIGMMMQMAEQSGSPPPKVVVVSSSDGSVTKDLKELFAKMVVANPRHRIKSPDVKKRLDEIYAPLASSLPPPPPRPETSSEPKERVESAKTSSGSGGMSGLGYHLLHQAIGQFVEDKLKKREAHDSLEELKKGGAIPLLELFKRILDSDEMQDEEKGQAARRGDDDFEPGQRVRIDNCGGDLDKVKKMQEKYGGWNSQMQKCIGKVGVVKQRVLHVIKVKFDDGNSWSFNPALLQKLDSSGNVQSDRSKQPDDYSKVVRSLYKRYDVVKIPEDRELVKLLQKGHGGWNDKMALCLGLKALVNRVDKDGDVFCECINGDDWVFNPELLIHDEQPVDADLEAGDFVLVIDDVDKVKRLHSSGLSDEMAKALGHTAIVKDVRGDRVVLECRQATPLFHRKAVKLVAKAEEMMVAILKKKLYV